MHRKQKLSRTIFQIQSSLEYLVALFSQFMLFKISKSRFRLLKSFFEQISVWNVAKFVWNLFSLELIPNPDSHTIFFTRRSKLPKRFNLTV